MTNIILTNNCNLKCPYCFANNLKNTEIEYISLKNFKIALNFIEQTENHIGLIGGEPTIHHQFNEILNIIKNDKKIKACTIYTNGVYINNFIEDIKNEKFYLLINCNTQNDMGVNFSEQLYKNIELISKTKKHYLKKTALGFNFYEKNIDYEFIIDIIKKYSFKQIRVSPTIPNNLNKNEDVSIESLKEIKIALFEFFKELDSLNILPYYDCNNIPICLLTENDKLFLERLKNKYNNKIYNFNLFTKSLCHPVIDILPNLSVIRCFGTSDITQIKLENFQNLNELKKYYTNKFDGLAVNIPTFIECKNCENFHKAICSSGCLTYKKSKIQSIKNIIYT